VEADIPATVVYNGWLNVFATRDMYLETLEG
jgi:hypothetical protein